MSEYLQSERSAIELFRKMGDSEPKIVVGLSEKENIFVLIDEAHRSQYIDKYTIKESVADGNTLPYV